MATAMLSWMSATDVAFSMVAVMQAVLAGVWLLGTRLLGDTRRSAVHWAGFSAFSAISERLREQLAAEPVHCDGTTVAVTVSIGVAQWTPADDVSRLLVRADAALYRAKQQGRNRVVAASAEPPVIRRTDAAAATQALSAGRR